MNLLDGATFRLMISSGCLRLERHCKEVNDLNVFPVPDGDTGSNMIATINGGVQAMASKPSSSTIGDLATSMRQGMLLSARGNSGVILSQFFAGLAEGLKGLEKASVRDFAFALQEGTKRAYSVVVKPVEGTILTVMREGYENANSMINNLTTFEEYFIALQSSMRESLANTPELLPVLKEAGVIDSGGAGLVYIIEGMAQALGGKIIEEVSLNIDPSNPVHIDYSSFDADSALNFGYCTEFIMQLTNQKDGPNTFSLQALIDYFSTFGDSLVAFQDGTLVKVHVHTKTPDLAIAYALKYGEFVTFKMENMTLQHQETLIEKSLDVSSAVKPIEAESKHVEISCVAVSPSKGITQQFKEYGVPVVIESTDLMNPDSNDFIKAFDKANADNIICLPNNKNELMVAHQAAKLYSKSWVYVLETQDVAKGISCASIMDLANLNLEDNLSRMESALSHARSLSIAKAAHAYRKGNLRVKAKDYIGIIDGEVAVASKTIEETFKLSLKLLAEAGEINVITMFVGDQIDEKKKSTLQAIVEDLDSMIELYVFDGGQHLYDVLACIE